jgi:chlorophyll synthase
MDLEDESYKVSPLKILRYLLKHMVPLFWGVSVFPFYMAWVFATRKLLPDLIFNIFTATESSSAVVNEFWIFVFALIALGPGLGASTLLYNDYWDAEIDRISKRKGLFPLPQGLLTQRTVFSAAIILMLVALLFSFLVSVLFLLLVGLCIILSLTYSTPPVRLKTRPGIDVATNALGSGLLCSVAGWIVARPLVEYPVLWGFTSLFGVSSIYIPTMIIDFDSDAKAGSNTFAVRLGKKRAFYAGLFCVTMANALIIYMGLIGYLIDAEFLLIAWPIAVAQVILYGVILRKLTFKSVYRTIMALSALLTLGNALLLTYYVGLWSIY